MKAERLLAILTALLGRDRISAGELARRLEVSTRTILRDMEALAEAGLPVYSNPGRDGGFSLVEGFRLDGQVLDTREIQDILAGLESLASAGQERGVRTLMEKFSLALRDSESKGVRVPKNHTFIELSPGPANREKIAVIETALRGNGAIAFSYVDSGGAVTERTVEPHALVHIWEGWYLYGWCALRSDWRLFKISRMRSVSALERRRTGPEANLDERPWREAWAETEIEPVTLLADGSLAGRFAEFFDETDMFTDGSGRLRIETDLPVNDWSVSFILGLPAPVRVLRPESLRNAVRARARALLEED